MVEAVRGLGEDLRGVALGPAAGALRPLVPELAPWLPAAPESLDDRRAERHRVFRGLLELLTASSAVQPVVVVLEDLHWADMQTREFIAYWLSGPVPPVALVEQADLIAFRHVLAAEAVCENLSGPRRRVLHRRAAGALRRMSPAPLGQIAYHLKHAADLDAWVDVAEAAADQAIALGDEEEAMRLLPEVLADAPLTSSRRGDLAVRLGWTALDTLYASAVIGPVSQALERRTSIATETNTLHR